VENLLKALYVLFRGRRKTLRPLAKMQRLSKTYVQLPLIGSFKREYIMTDIENEKIIPPLKLMTRNEVMNDLLKLLDLVQKHADKEGYQHCLNLLESVFEH
jgi:hypothetical protein